MSIVWIDSGSQDTLPRLLSAGLHREVTEWDPRTLEPIESLGLLDHFLGGGFTHIFFGIFTPDLWGDDPNFTNIFEMGLKPPTSFDWMMSCCPLG